MTVAKYMEHKTDLQYIYRDYLILFHIVNSPRADLLACIITKRISSDKHRRAWKQKVEASAHILKYNNQHKSTRIS